MRGTRNNRTEQARTDLCRKCEYLPRCKLRSNIKSMLGVHVLCTSNCDAYEPAKDLR
jgi:hypothetical protein